MSEVNVRFQTMDDMIDFLRKVEKYPYRMRLNCGNVVLNAKSLLCVVYIGINQAANLVVSTDDCNDLCRDIERYIVA
ncbi:MAG: HPr family phosphocarrier protein [Clostridiales bacterium]|nr:HPr family phosphocarrier protein [Clostridiales bacterium]